MRKKIYEMVEAGSGADHFGEIYDGFMMLCICISIIPLTVKVQNTAMRVIDISTVTVFIVDYLLRLFTADFKLKKGRISFLEYPFTFMAILDLISILPSIRFLNRGFRLLRVFRLARTFRVFRVFKAFRYFKSLALLLHVFQKQKDNLMVVCWLAIGYIMISALIMFNAEPATFPSFFDAVYWATISLTTVGYGDLYAITPLGKTITMISALFGIAIVALPAGILSAGYLSELNKEKE